MGSFRAPGENVISFLNSTWQSLCQVGSCWVLLTLYKNHRCTINVRVRSITTTVELKSAETEAFSVEILLWGGDGPANRAVLDW